MSGQRAGAAPAPRSRDVAGLAAGGLGMACQGDTPSELRRRRSGSHFAGGCPRVGGCNETRMLEKLPLCGKAFADMMHKVDVWKWCNLSEFIVYYETFTNCTEVETNVVGCYWPNPLAQGFISGVHRQFFANCTVDRTHWEDPPDEVLIPLIAVPVLLTVAMAGLVVWRSKRPDQLL
ncbi:receptor activity-modifying protein 3 isoform X1 [Leptonychotes weddellii]|uniref:Receptor activity-modifying protein 3 n=2 Tax=Leptonychotes weddellii TaxID=9713 RepID=A0A7F8R229_LEPWE|nr:receptor activity-modifying protein 3 isoform X1 [Leptonychotes weddellii]